MRIEFKFRKKNGLVTGAFSVFNLL